MSSEEKTKAVEEENKSTENRKVILDRAKEYAEEYDAQETEPVQLKREAALLKGLAAKVFVPESVLRKKKREELWAAEKKAVEEKSIENRTTACATHPSYAAVLLNSLS